MSETQGITIYSIPNCMGCKMTAAALEKAGVRFSMVDLTTLPPEVIAAFKAEGFMQAPIVQTGQGEQWSGFRPDKIKQAVETMPASMVEDALAAIHEARSGKPQPNHTKPTTTPPDPTRSDGGQHRSGHRPPRR